MYFNTMVNNRDELLVKYLFYNWNYEKSYRR